MLLMLVVQPNLHGDRDDDGAIAGASGPSADTSEDEERRHPAPGNGPDFGFHW